MKTKLTKKPEIEIDDEDADIEVGGPGIASAKKNKIMLIVACSLFITAVIYFMFLKGDEKKPEKLEVVSSVPQNVAQADGGKSPFEINENVKSKDDVDVLAKPSIPDVPALPKLAEGDIPKDQSDLIPNQVPNQQNGALTGQQASALLPGQQNQVAQPTQNAAASSQQSASTTEEKKPINPRYSPILVFSGGDAGPSLGVGYDKNIVNLKDDPLDKMTRVKSTVVTTYIGDRTQTIAQGKMLTAVLETAINTEIPGLVRAVVSRDVYAESGTNVLIPRGSRLYGSYSSVIARGQGRVQISWTRLLRPDGVTMAITFNASDQFGRSGISGEVDNRYSSIIASSMLTSVIALGGIIAAQKLVGGNAQTVTTTNPQQGTTTTSGDATNNALNNFSQSITGTIGQIISNNINTLPIIRVPQGTRITVIVNSNIIIPPMKKTN